jgi:hypothetical protein
MIKLQTVINRFANSFFGKFLMNIFYKIYEFLRYRKSLYEHSESDKKLKILLGDLTVRDGFMKGLKYPEFKSFGSSIFPKLTGTYENELHQTFETFGEKKYSCIVDIGCAEGYYAVGLASHFKNANIFAFDIDENAQKLCKEMSKLNKVEDRVFVRQECTRELLRELVGHKKSLIISDCEGFERHFFVKQMINDLVNCDLIIELHPMNEKDVKNYLQELFKETHSISYISSYDDKRKMFELGDQYKELSDLDKLKLVQEGRSFTMDWLIAKSKYDQC